MPNIKIATEVDWYASQQDPWYFVKNFCMTFDEHDQSIAGECKPFPDMTHGGKYKDEVFEPLFGNFHMMMQKAQELKKARVVLVPKSRQMMVSWSVASFCLWAILFFGRSHIVWQSKKEKDSDYQIDRIKHMYSYLPKYFRERVGITTAVMSRQHHSYLRLLNGSRAEAVASGGSIVRSRVPTVFVNDESAFQDEFEDSLSAALASSQLIIAVSSPEAGHFQREVEDTDGEQNEDYAGPSHYTAQERDGDGDDDPYSTFDRAIDSQAGEFPVRRESGRGWTLVR